MLRPEAGDTGFSDDILLFDCKLMPNARATSLDDYSECGYSFKKSTKLLYFDCGSNW